MIKIGKAGSGTYGTVYRAKMGKKDVTEIAVKRNIIDADVSFSGSIRELDLLNRLRGHPYIIKLISVAFGNPFITPSSPIMGRKKEYKEDNLHFIFEKGEYDLHNLIYVKNVQASDLKSCMVQILLAVEYMHAKGVIHRDIKPANLLWFGENDKSSIKICDFGLSKVHTNQAPSSPHVVTCWYRAPEICCHNNYSFSSDMWSVGCVFYEMIARHALLLGYKDDDNKILSKIIDLSPSATPTDIYKLTKGKKISLKKEASPKHKKSWRQMINLSEAEIKEFNKYPNGDNNEATYEEFLDLIDKILRLDPDQRLTATTALEHPFFKPYQNVIDWCRHRFPPMIKTEPIIKIIDCIERKWIIRSAFKMFNRREELPWFSYRILFQSIDMFDRYIVYYDGLGNFEIPSENNGKYLTKENSILKYMVCLYMCIKYFTTLSVPISYSELVKKKYQTTKALLKAEEYEQKMLRDVLNFRVYRETIYEAADRMSLILDDYKVRDILEQYGIISSRHDITPTHLLNEILTIITE